MHGSAKPAVAGAIIGRQVLQVVIRVGFAPVPTTSYIA